MTTTTTPYRAIFCDLRTDDTIDILPLRDVTVDDYIGKAGSLSGTVPVPNAQVAARVRRIEEGRTAVYLQRGNDLWWGGIIWTSTLQSDDRGVLTLGIQAATFESYAGRRRIRQDLTFSGSNDQRRWRGGCGAICRPVSSSTTARLRRRTAATSASPSGRSSPG